MSLTLDLGPIGAFFDTTNASPGNSSSPLTLDVSSTAVGIFPDNASVDGSSSLTITFASFVVGQTFGFGVDTDFFSSPDATGLRGTDFAGATATAVFSDGSTRTGTYVRLIEQDVGAEVDIVTDPVPEPGTLLLIGSGLTGLALRRRRRQ